MASKRIKGITIEIGGETTGLQKALADVNKKSSELKTELRDVDRLLKFDPGNAEAIAQKQKLLAEQVENTADKLKQLKDAEKQVQDQVKRGDISEKQYRDFRREIEFTETELKNMKDQLGKVNNGAPLKELKKDADKATGSMKDLGGEIAGVIGGLAAGGGIAGAVDQALDVSSLDTSIDITFDVPEESKASVKAAVRDIEAYGLDAEEALEGVRRQWALNADVSDEVNAKIVKDAGTIAKAYSGIDFTELIQETNEISRELGVTNEEALAMTNALLKVGFPPEQLDIIAEYGKQLSDAGYNAEEIQAIMAAGIDTGTWNIDNLLDGVKEGRIRMAEFGQEVPEAMADLLESTDISAKQMQEWGKAVAEGGEGGKKAMEDVANALKGVEDDTTRNALGAQVFGTIWEDQGSNITDTLLNMDDHLSSAKNNQEQLNSAVSSMDASPAVQMQQAIGDLKIALEPVLEVVANVITKIAEWVQQNPTLAATLTAVATAIGILIGIAMALAPIFMAVSASAAAAGVSIGAILAPIGIAIAAIAAIIAIGVLLWKNWDTIKAKAIEIWGAIKSFFATTTEAIKNGLTRAWNSIKSTTSSVFNSIKSTISNIWNSIKSSVSSTVGSMVSTVKNKFQDIVNGVRDKMNDVLSKVKEIWGKVKGFFEGIDLFSIGSDIIRGLINGIGSMADAVWEKAKGIAEGIGEKIADTLGVQSPSRVTMEIGEYTGEGLAIGMEKTLGMIGKASDKMADAARPNVEDSKVKSTQITRNGPTVNVYPQQAIIDQREISKELRRMEVLYG
jgi:phage-related minor tail protein